MEIWKPIIDFPDYAVSSLGRIKRVKVGRGTNAKNGILKRGVSKKGYFRVYLSKNSKQYTKAVHRLVAQAFVPNPRNLPQVNHLDTNKKNCKVSNLEWSDQDVNMLHASLHRLHGDGVYIFNNKWEVYLRIENKRRYFGGYPTKSLAKKVREYVLKRKGKWTLDRIKKSVSKQFSKTMRTV